MDIVEYGGFQLFPSFSWLSIILLQKYKIHIPFHFAYKIFHFTTNELIYICSLFPLEWGKYLRYSETLKKSNYHVMFDETCFNNHHVIYSLMQRVGVTELYNLYISDQTSLKIYFGFVIYTLSLSKIQLDSGRTIFRCFDHDVIFFIYPIN